MIGKNILFYPLLLALKQIHQEKNDGGVPMKSFYILKLILIVVVLFTISFPADAQYSAGRLFTFIQDIYNRHDNKLNDFLIVELNQFLQTFPDSGKASDASFLLARVYDEKGKEHEALAATFKTFFVFPDANRQIEYTSTVQEIIKNENAYREKKEKLLAVLNSPSTVAKPADRYFAYLSFLMELDEAKLCEWTLNEARYFSSRFPNDEHLYKVMQWIADLYVKMDKPREAVASYARLDLVDPTNPELPYAWYHRARLLHEEIGDFQTAMDIANQIVMMYPSSEYAAASLFLLGEIKEKKIKDYDGALVAYRKLVDTYPQNTKSVNAMLAIGEINTKKLKNYTAAIATYTEFIDKFKSSPRGVEAVEAIGDIYQDNLKDYQKAAEYYAKVAELYPTYEKAPDMLLRAGSICEDKLSDPNKAIEYYQQIIDKYPDSKKAGDAAKKITKAREKISK